MLPALTVTPSAAASTRARVSALTAGLPDKARDTVGCETPANAAISNDVGRRCAIGGKAKPAEYVCIAEPHSSHFANPSIGSKNWKLVRAALPRLFVQEG